MHIRQLQPTADNTAFAPFYPRRNEAWQRRRVYARTYTREFRFYRDTAL